MSKPIARVVLAILVSLVLIAATYFTVQGALPKVGAGSAQVHVVNGLQTNLNHYRTSIYEANYASPANGPHQGGGCHSDSQNSPGD
ncbi:MAG TPA: hypothetical protein VF896_02830 [Anaerolineales bacterium]